MKVIYNSKIEDTVEEIIIKESGEKQLWHKFNVSSFGNYSNLFFAF